MSDGLHPRGCAQLQSGAAGEGRAWKWWGWEWAEAKRWPLWGGCYQDLGELVDWEHMASLEDASSALTEGEQEREGC